MEVIVTSLQFIADSAVDVLPIAVFLFAFQRLVIGEPLPNWKQIVVGFLFVVVGLGLFLMDPTEIDIAGYVRVAVADAHDSIGAARSALQPEIGRYAGNPFYRAFFRQMGFEAEMAGAEQALARGDVAGAAQAITPAMQDELALMGSTGECREELERVRRAGLQQPVIAPFAVGDHVPSYRRAIEAFRE